MAKQKINQEQSKLAWAYSTIGVELAAGNKTFPGITTKNITPTSTSRLTVQIPGIYYISARQLVSSSAAGWYWAISINGTMQAYGYASVAVSTFDMRATWSGPLAAGDYVELYHSATMSAAWTGQHSNFTMFKIGE